MSLDGVHQRVAEAVSAGGWDSARAACVEVELTVGHTAESCAVHVLLLLASGNIVEARALCERSQESFQSNEFFAKALDILRKLGGRKYEEFFGVCGAWEAEVAGPVSNLVQHLISSVRARLWTVLERAYTVVRTAEVARVLGFGSPEEATALACERGWKMKGSEFLTVATAAPEQSQILDAEKHMQQLLCNVAFLQER